MMKRRKKGVGRKPAFLVDKHLWRNIRDNLFILRMQEYANFWKEYRKVANSIDRSGAERIESNFYFLLATASVFGEQFDTESKFYIPKITGSLFNILSLTQRHQERKRYDPLDDALKGILLEHLENGEWVDKNISTSVIGTLVHARLTEWEKIDIRTKTNWKTSSVLGREINKRLDNWGFPTERLTSSSQTTLRHLEKKAYYTLFGREVVEDENGKNKITDFLGIKPDELNKRVNHIKEKGKQRNFLMKTFTDLANSNKGKFNVNAFYEGLKGTSDFKPEDIEIIKPDVDELLDYLLERGSVVATGKEGEFELKV